MKNYEALDELHDMIILSMNKPNLMYDYDTLVLFIIVNIINLI